MTRVNNAFHQERKVFPEQSKKKEISHVVN